MRGVFDEIKHDADSLDRLDFLHVSLHDIACSHSSHFLSRGLVNHWDVLHPELQLVAA